MDAQQPAEPNTGKWETPGSFAIMLIYFAWFGVMWLLSFAFLAAQWAIS